MYKIDVKSDGKYHNVMIGARYALTKRAAERAIDCFLKSNCDIEVKKFIKTVDVWVWSDDHDLYGGLWEEG